MDAYHLIPHDSLTIPLWPDGTIPVSSESFPESDEILPNGLTVLRNVTQPALTVFRPEPAQATGSSVIVAPGGGYHFLAYDHEGLKVVDWLNKHGITAFLLKYRLVQTGDDFPQCMEDRFRDREVMMQFVASLFPQITADGCQAVALVRERAAELGVHPQKIGIMGFSAGGFVTLSTALNYSAASRPDFAAPIYPAPPQECVVPQDAPPLFLLTADDDAMASVVCQEYYAKWKNASRPVEAHFYARGGHGFGMNPLGLPVDSWIERFGAWMKAEGF